MEDVDADSATLRFTPAGCVTSYATCCDWVHDTLIGLGSADKDAVVLETFAWLAVEADRQGAAGWINEWTNDAFADAADQALPDGADDDGDRRINKDKLPSRSEEHTSELQSLMRISYAVFCLKKKKN